MATKAIALLVTGHAAFQVLASRLGMAEDPGWLIAVERSRDGAPTLESHAQVALAAEGLLLVAGGAVADPAEGLSPVGGQEVEGMEFRRTLGVMALDAGVLRVTG